jgi:hypothetical protein
MSVGSGTLDQSGDALEKVGPDVLISRRGCQPRDGDSEEQSKNHTKLDRFLVRSSLVVSSRSP